MIRPGSSWQRLALLAFLSVLIFAAFSARVILEGESELSASDAAFDRGELASALDHARRAATLYAPGAPHVERAYERLNALALGAEAAGQPKIAFLAWQATRSAALESRTSGCPARQSSSVPIRIWLAWRPRPETALAASAPRPKAKR